MSNTQKVESSFDLYTWLIRHIGWSSRTFGLDQRTEGVSVDKKMTLAQLWDNATTASQRNLILLRSGMSLYNIQHRCKSYFLQWNEVHPIVKRRIQVAWDENKYSDLIKDHAKIH